MTVQSDRYTKPVFLGFLLTVFGFGFFQEPPQPINENESLSYIFQTTLPEFKSSDFSVVRGHEEFVWLHDRYVENDEYAGIIVSLSYSC